jgi:hypothetical protein
MAAPMPLHKFRQLIKEHGCHSEQKSSSTHFYIYTSAGKFVSSYAVKKGNSVLQCYVSEFLKAVKG